MTNIKFTQTLSVAGAIIQKDGKFLLVKEAGGLDKGKWNHPAGIIDIGEDPIVTARREILEETGYIFEPTHLLGVYSFVKYNVGPEHIPVHAIKLIFKGNFNDNKPNDLHYDIAEVKWFSADEIYTMDQLTLRDDDIKQMVKDHLNGKGTALDVVTHTEAGAK